MFIIRNEQNRQQCIDAIRNMPLHPVQQVKIGDYKRNRTREQNDALHSWFRAIAEHTGYTEEEVKDKLVLTVFEPTHRQVKVKRGNEFEEYTLVERRSTADLSVEEFIRLQDATLMVAHTLNVTLQPYGGS